MGWYRIQISSRWRERLGREESNVRRDKLGSFGRRIDLRRLVASAMWPRHWVAAYLGLRRSFPSGFLSLSLPLTIFLPLFNCCLNNYLSSFFVYLYFLFSYFFLNILLLSRFFYILHASHWVWSNYECAENVKIYFFLLCFVFCLCFDFIDYLKCFIIVLFFLFYFILDVFGFFGLLILLVDTYKFLTCKLFCKIKLQ